ncbi:MAG: esterase-like activity of phytase family protein [Candidatus Solibacter usitatus]|nr:esterase-like activity of phytase family protein [Candidatus Solibacter usitatus]
MKGQLPLPDKFLVRDVGGVRSGVRANNGFEALSLSPDGTRLYAGAEGALEQDGPGCSFTPACTARIIEYTLHDGAFQPAREFLYPINVMPRPAGFGESTGLTGLSDFLALDGGSLLTMERSFALDTATKQSVLRIQLFQAGLAGAADSKPVAKRLVLDLDTIIGRLEPAWRRLDNMEGICFGPRLKDGSRTVILVSDDNYAETQRTVFLLFKLEAEPGSAAALPAPEPRSEDWPALWQVSKEFTLAVAAAMPEEHYLYAPAPEEMPFAGLMLHIARAQAIRFAQVAGAAGPFDERKPIDKAKPKAGVLALLAESFDFCMGLSAQLTPERLEKTYKVDWFERPEVTGSLLLTAMFVHTAHHRGQAEVYLRAKGVKPPAYRF